MGGKKYYNFINYITNINKSLESLYLVMENCDVQGKYLDKSLKLYIKLEKLKELDLEIEYENDLDENFSLEEDNEYNEKKNYKDNESNND